MGGGHQESGELEAVKILINGSHGTNTFPSGTYTDLSMCSDNK